MNPENYIAESHVAVVARHYVAHDLICESCRIAIAMAAMKAMKHMKVMKALPAAVPSTATSSSTSSKKKKRGEKTAQLEQIKHKRAAAEFLNEDNGLDALVKVLDNHAETVRKKRSRSFKQTRAAANKKIETAAKLGASSKSAAATERSDHDVLRAVGISMPQLGLYDPEI